MIRLLEVYVVLYNNGIQNKFNDVVAVYTSKKEAEESIKEIPNKWNYKIFSDYMTIEVN